MTGGAWAGPPPIRVDASGSRSTVWWGMILLVTIEGAVFASILFSYFHLRVAAPDWPLDGIERPELVLPSIATGLLLASAAFAVWSTHGIRHGDRRRLVLGVLAGMAFVAGYTAVKLIEYADQDFGWQTNAYGSIYWTIAGYHLFHVANVLVFALVVVLLAMRGRFDRDRHQGVDALRIYWLFVALGWLPFYGAVYLSPHLF